MSEENAVPETQGNQAQGVAAGINNGPHGDEQDVQAPAGEAVETPAEETPETPAEAPATPEAPAAPEAPEAPATEEQPQG